MFITLQCSVDSECCVKLFECEVSVCVCVCIHVCVCVLVATYDRINRPAGPKRGVKFSHCSDL